MNLELFLGMDLLALVLFVCFFLRLGVGVFNGFRVVFCGWYVCVLLCFICFELCGSVTDLPWVL